jgi:hypothetical protein
MKRYFGDRMSVGAQMVVVVKACVERCVPLGLGHPFEFSRLEVSQQMYFIVLLLRVKPAALPGALDRSSYSRRAQEKSTAEGNCFYF